MAKPIGMPMAHQPKNSANMTQEARLMPAETTGRQPPSSCQGLALASTSLVPPSRCGSKLVDGRAKPGHDGCGAECARGCDLSQLVLPLPSQQAAQPHHRGDDRARHEDSEAGIEDV